MLINIPLQWRHNGLDGVSNHQPHHCLLSRLFGRRSKKTSKLRVTGLCAGNSPGTGEFPAQMASNAENAFIWWRHHAPTENIFATILYIYGLVQDCSIPIVNALKKQQSCTNTSICALSDIRMSHSPNCRTRTPSNQPQTVVGKI